jgi:DNA-binding protein
LRVGWKKDGEAILKDIYEINNIRKDIFHSLKIKEVKFKSKLLTSEEGIETFADIVHQRLLDIDDLIELIQK